MRTKTLALSAVIGMLGTASVLAQNVYSINAVGYVNVTIPPGFSILTCPLQATPDNTLNTLLPDNAPAVPYNNFTAYQFSGGAFTAIANGGGPYSPGWSAAVTINPGQAIFINNPGSSVTATFVGTVPQTTVAAPLTVPLTPGYNLVGSEVPFSGDLALNAGVSGNDFPDLNKSVGAFDYIYFFNPGTQKFAAAVTEGGPYSPGWSGGTGAGGDPATTSVTQGFYYYNASAQTGGGAHTENWTEVFSINP